MDGTAGTSGFYGWSGTAVWYSDIIVGGEDRYGNIQYTFVDGLIKSFIVL